MSRNLSDNALVHKKEKRYFVICLLVSLFLYAGISVSIIGIPWLALLFGVPFVLHALAMAHLRKNGVRLSARQFPQVYERINVLCAKMGLPTVPDVFVVESGGLLNAFATRFFGRNMVVLYADVFELILHGGNDELDFVVAHELAHLKRRHITKNLLLLPAQWVPFLSQAYARACEYTCDRMAAYYTENLAAATNGLVMLAIGKTLFRHVNVDEYLHQCAQETGFFVWLAEKLSTHPPLPKRVAEVRRFMEHVSGTPVPSHAGPTMERPVETVL